MKVIFLDIDGVLNVLCEGRDEFGCIFHKHFEDNLKNIIKQTQAKIVISSTWRADGLQKMQDMWVKRGLAGEVIDITPMEVEGELFERYYEPGADRGYEIQQYIEDHPKITKYCIIDDDSDMLNHQLKYFVRTFANRDHSDYVDIGYGLTKECSEQAIKILNK
jgi:hypothetical protein